jgi:ribosomal protein RSM22 (predicted rRNA methylase)
MQLPPPLRRAIEQELAACDPAQLRAAATRLSEGYREPSARTSPALGDDLQRAAYLAVRMPATYAAVVAALDWTREACDNEHLGIRTLLDLGSGPGTALWAAAEVFPTLASATAIERDPRILEIGRKLGALSGDAVLCNANWLRGDLTLGLNKDVLPPGTWDLVVCSYALNELAAAQRAGLLRQAWERCAKLLVVVEPGTTAGFANILAARTLLLGAGATLAAPCPNSLACPMANGGDWCHFAARVERTATHRRLKEATLGHEDEKFSYVAVGRGPVSRASHDDESQSSNPPTRIVRHPRIFSGYTQLALCREGQIACATVTRSQKEDWRRLKRLGWGDRW